jgi:hypothetical protein
MQKQGVKEGFYRIKSITLEVKISINVHSIGISYGVFAVWHHYG